MAATTTKIKNQLRDLGLSHEAVQAAWPTWWSEEAERSPSALNDLKFSLSRKLGIAPASLFDEGNAVFVWQGEAKFKGLTTETGADKEVLTSFGMSIARLLLLAHEARIGQPIDGLPAVDLRSALLNAGAPHVAISHLLRLSRSLGIPVAYLRVFPLETKSMTAMTVRIGDRFAILLGKDAMYSAPVSFYIAHEIGHIARGHLVTNAALVDMDIESVSLDREEVEADAFALALLTGQAQVTFDTNRPPKNATELANAVCSASKREQVDPGILAMCYGHANQQWKLAMAALKIIYGNGKPAWQEINKVALESLDLGKLTSDNREYLESVTGFVQNA